MLPRNLKNYDPNRVQEFLKELKNAAEQPLVSTKTREDYQVSLRPDKTVSRGKFKPDPLVPGGYCAHPVTIRAMRKDLFVLGQDGFEDLELLITCESCAQQLDYQFWHFCPYCEAQLPKPSDL